MTTLAQYDAAPAARISPVERKVLAVLAGGSEDFYHTFKGIARYARLKRAVIRRACRSLARKGLAQYGRGLWTEDGEPAGSGYAATKQGRASADEAIVEKYAARRWE